MKKEIVRAAVEVGFIVFLFYSNLLMGEYSRSGAGNSHRLWWAIEDVVTWANFAIAMLAGVVGYVVFEFLRKKL